MLINFNSKQKKMLISILVSAVLYIGLILFFRFGPFKEGGRPLPEFLLYAVPYFIAGGNVLKKAFVNICHGKVFDENFLMTIATFGAFAVGENTEAVAVMLFYQTGELFQNYAVEKSRRSISEMMDIFPEFANLEVGPNVVQVDPEGVETGSVIVIRPGERMPLDGIVIEGSSAMDTSALTGESMPREVSAGSEVYSGCVNGGGTLRVRTTAEYDDSTAARILELVEDAGMNKARVENFITRFAGYYTPAVTAGAVLIALVPSLITGEWMEWIQRACIFLIVSCPCALVISVPLGFFGGIGAASRRGIMVKGSNFLEAAAGIRTVMFDKTGTITEGAFEVTEIRPVQSGGAGHSKKELLELAAVAEGYSTHPAAQSIIKSYGRKPDLSRVKNCREIPGRGVAAEVDGRVIYAGSGGFMEEQGIEYVPNDSPGTVVYLAAAGDSDGAGCMKSGGDCACGKVFLGSIVIADSVRAEAAETVKQLRDLGVENIEMLTGDGKSAGERAAARAGIDRVHWGLLPGDKVRLLEKAIAEQPEGARTAFVGDGINDAPVLMRSDVGIAMGNMGSDAAVEAADIVIMDDDISKTAELMRIAKKTMRIVRQNIIFALGIKALVLILGALGAANMWEAVFADVGVAVIAILNSMRALKP